MTSPLPPDSRLLQWNLPARISHWGFSSSFSLALYFGYSYEPESELFKYHIIASLLCCWFLLVRIFLGFLGSRPMRWRAFLHTPRSVCVYFVRALSGNRMDYPGLNPGSFVFAISLYLGLVALLYTGFVADLAETWHARLAGLTLAAIATHILGLLLHALRHRALTPLSMIHGNGIQITEFQTVRQNVSGGILLLILSILATAALVKYFDLSNSVLSIPFLPELVFPVIQKG